MSHNYTMTKINKFLFKYLCSSNDFPLLERCARHVGAKLHYRVREDVLRVTPIELQDTNILFVSAFPKSGSTYFSALLHKITGFPSGECVQFFQHNEQDLFEVRLQNLLGKNVVIQQHAKGTCNNLALMKKYQIKPVVLLRNIFDVIISLMDHFQNEDDQGASVYIHPEYYVMSQSEKIDFLIANCLPWYFAFFASWRDAEKKHPVYFLTYEKLFSDQCSEVKKVISYFDLPFQYTDEHILSSIKSMPASGNRKNVGRADRGVETLSDQQQSCVVDLARSWKICDNSMKLIGLEI